MVAEILYLVKVRTSTQRTLRVLFTLMMLKFRLRRECMKFVPVNMNVQKQKSGAFCEGIPNYH